MQRLDYIDLAKGLGILLVVIGHGILRNFGISVFHMPLFFFLAGLTFTPPTTTNGSLGVFVLKKFNRIFIPWVFFSLVSGIAELFIGRIQPQALFNGPLWFLECLICTLAIYVVLHSLFKSVVILHLFVGSIPVCVYFLSNYTMASAVLPFEIIRALYAVVYLHLGWCFKNYRLEEKSNVYANLIIALTLYLLGLYISVNNYELHGADFYNSRAYTYDIILPIVTATSAILLVICISCIFKKIRFINWLGINSLVIMAVHYPIQERLNQLVFFCFTDLGLSSPLIKLLLVMTAYAIDIGCCAIFIVIFKKYLPKLTGYGNLIPL